MCARNSSVTVAALFVALWLLAGTAAPAVVVVSFDDGTSGALNASVNVSSKSLTTIVSSDVHAPAVSGKALYAKYSYGSPGQDKAVIDTAQAFSNVVTSDVVTLEGTGNGGGAGGVVAGMPAASGSGYLLYLTNAWNQGGGAWWDSSVGGAWQLVVVKKLAGSANPLAAGNVYQAIQVAGVTPGLPNYVQLSVNGNTITGQVWAGQTSATGAQTAVVSLTDSSPLSGYVGAYLAGRNLQCPYVTNWGVASVDDFTAGVPEPASLLLAAIGLIGFRRYRRP